jgi:hypothetical protein
VVHINGKEVACGNLPGQTSDWGEPAEDYPDENEGSPVPWRTSLLRTAANR